MPELLSILTGMSRLIAELESYSNFINASVLPVTLPVGLTWGADYYLPTTYSMTYLLNIQRTLGTSTTLEAGYSGSQSRHLYGFQTLNQAAPGPIAAGAGR